MKTKMRMAIIGGSSGDALVESCKKRGLHTILIAGSKNDRGYGLADENYEIDLINKKEIVELIHKKSDCLLLGTGHKLAHDIAMELYNLKFPVSINPHSADYGKNKLKAYDLVNNLGYKAPQYITIKPNEKANTFNREEILLPCVVKSEDDTVKTAKANNQSELNRLLDEHAKKNSIAIVEEFVEGVEYTIPVVSDGINYQTYEEALDMTNINKIAVAHLRNFDDMDAKYDRKQYLTQELRKEICKMSLKITKEMGLVGLVRYDLMVSTNMEIYFLEVNEVAVSRIGPDHYPWQEVNLNIADIMVENTLNLFEMWERNE